MTGNWWGASGWTGEGVRTARTVSLTVPLPVRVSRGAGFLSEPAYIWEVFTKKNCGCKLSGCEFSKDSGMVRACQP